MFSKKNMQNVHMLAINILLQNCWTCIIALTTTYLLFKQKFPLKSLQLKI